MIHADGVIPLLLEACPSFRDAWPELEMENAGDGDGAPSERLHYLDAGGFVRHLVQLRLRGDSSEFPAVFAVIEQMTTVGDDYVKDLAVIGYLEGLQMRTVTGAGLDPDVEFRPLLGAVSLRWWDRLNGFWAGDVQALQVQDP